ncbi:hypothetical protein A2U01_0015727 [Trifolium medium]|uniref:Uncharacterized protein n=1 Tax=Trifolium medium TaxID=97028 RepID=A0A392N5B2_9FABA|nr:hypothetical protein [Trifolium medium]
MGQPAIWNQALIDQNFMPSEGELIKQIPLIKEVVDDQIMWIYSLDGNHTMKTGYHPIGIRPEGPSNRDTPIKCLKQTWYPVQHYMSQMVLGPLSGAATWDTSGAMDPMTDSTTQRNYFGNIIQGIQALKN